MNYKVLIPAAGTGSRLGELTCNINKPLVAIAHKPSISYIIEKFPIDTPIVIALGYKGDLLKEYLRLAYSERIFEFVTIDPYEGEGSGLGLSILSCKDKLQCPFVFCSCDTLVDEKIPAPDCNWLGYASLDSDLKQYRTVKLNNQGKVTALLEKGSTEKDIYPYIGLAGIKDFKLFWQSMEAGKSNGSISIGESYAIQNLKDIHALEFTWNDSGNLEALKKLRAKYHDENGPNILEKPTEAIWFVNDKVIKFNTDKSFISDRVERTKVLGDFVPKILASTEHMYSYKKLDGDVVSDLVNLKIFEALLDYSQEFWQASPKQARILNNEEKENFKKVCFDFYQDKTFKRVRAYFDKFENKDSEESINGFLRPKTIDLLERLDWDWVCQGLPGNFHGDFHFENILYQEDTGKFSFLDWRQNFGGIIDYGDIYYDLGKLNHGLIVNHEIVARDLYSAKKHGNEISYDIHRKQSLVECEGFLANYLIANDYDYKKVYLMTALIYLNIAALHHYPYCHLLYYLGKDMLAKVHEESYSVNRPNTAFGLV